MGFSVGLGEFRRFYMALELGLNLKAINNYCHYVQVNYGGGRIEGFSTDGFRIHTRLLECDTDGEGVLYLPAGLKLPTGKKRDSVVNVWLDEIEKNLNVLHTEAHLQISQKHASIDYPDMSKILLNYLGGETPVLEMYLDPKLVESVFKSLGEHDYVRLRLFGSRKMLEVVATGDRRFLMPVRGGD